MRKKSSILGADLKTASKEGANAVYFKKDDTVTFVAKHKTNFQWIEVSGTAYYMAGKVEKSAGVKSGYVARKATSMTVGNFEGLNVDDQTGTYGDLGIGTEDKVGTIVLHETDGDTAAGTKRGYAARINEGSHTGAQYLIGEDGAITLVVPANEVVYHVRGNKPKKVTKPAHDKKAKEWAGEMATVRKEIENYFSHLDVMTIPQSTRDQLLGLSDSDLYDLLNSNGWTIYKKIDNSHSVGIEVVGRHKNMYAADPGFSDDTMTDIFAKLNSADFTMAPSLKEQLLKTAERAAIKANTELKPEDKKKKTDKLNKDLYNLLKANGWNLYADISGTQKYSSWMLVNKLAKHFGLDVSKDAIAHNQADSKTLGEGENNMEFIRTMADMKVKLPVVESKLKAKSTPLTGDFAFVADIRLVVDSTDSGKMLTDKDKNYTKLMAFFNAFYSYKDKLNAAFAALNK